MKKAVFLPALAIIFSAFSIADEQPLEFEAGYLVDGKPGLQPSGLAVCSGEIVFVSDKHEQEIYKLVFHPQGAAKQGIAGVKTWKTLSSIPAPPKQDFSFTMRFRRFVAELAGISGGMDWEGIACDRFGNTFLASEYYFSILKIDTSGKMEWLADNLYQRGNKVGLFQKDNAYVEGLTLQDGVLLLAAEREPRGIIALDGGSASFHVQPEPQSSGQDLPLDYTGLEAYNGKIIALERNHYQVCQLSQQYESKPCYSFKEVATSSDWGYNTGKYGLAEGVAVDGNSLWIIVDNNGDTRKADADDSRSTILKFKNPF
ncbi:hypothetical protein [Microbulbifer sp. TYP-18]|uniref:hypothetical protein n=1 Tax=Microbulbifer sp. TYP-18 TaxID=3230024 RepID=UPI0034C5F622